MIACCVQRESEGPAATNGPACFSKWTELEDTDLSTSSETGNEKAMKRAIGEGEAVDQDSQAETADTAVMTPRAWAQNSYVVFSLFDEQGRD
jgi:hypothetical protein